MIRYTGEAPLETCSLFIYAGQLRHPLKLSEPKPGVFERCRKYFFGHTCFGSFTGLKTIRVSLRVATIKLAFQKRLNLKVAIPIFTVKWSYVALSVGLGRARIFVDDEPRVGICYSFLESKSFFSL